MRVFEGLSDIVREPKSVMTVGTFDGVHLGHRYIIGEVVARAKAAAVPSTIVTFDPHPKIVLAKTSNYVLELLTTTGEKIRLLRELSIDRLVIIPFTIEFAQTSSEAFVRNYLYQKIGFNHLVIGFDHAFGKNREGGIDTLRRMGAELSFMVDELPEFVSGDHRLKSTSVRTLLKNGNVSDAADALGRPYLLHGTVVAGDGRGRQLDFPTANIAVSSKHKLIPGNGVYAVHTTVDGVCHPGMMNIGTRPTFGDATVVLEVHIIGFGQDIYGHELQVEFVERIRDERAFSGRAELVEQLRTDKQQTLEILKNRSN